MCVLLLAGEGFCQCRFDPVDWWCCLVLLCPYWFSACWICQLLTEGVEVCSYTGRYVCCSLQLYQFASRMLTLSCEVHLCLGLVCLFGNIDPFIIMS